MKTKAKKLRAYLVYAWVPVNVKIKASSAEKAEELAQDVLSRTRPLDLTTDDSLPIYIDDGVPAKTDKQRPALLDEDDMAERDREYATEERA